MALVLCSLSLPEALSATSPPLRPNEPITNSIGSEETHTYTAELSAGPWRVTVDQQGVDVEVTATAAGSEELVVDSPLDREGTESLLLEVDEAASYRITIRARERAAPSGRYHLSLALLPTDTQRARQRLNAERARAAAARAYASGAERRLDALELYRTAAAHWRNVGDDSEATRDLYCAAVLLRIAGKTQEALQAARDVLPRWQALGDQYWEAATLNEIGLNRWNLGESQEARIPFAGAVQLWRALDHDTIALHAQNNTCLTYLTSGDLKSGLACYQPLLDAAVLDNEPALAATFQTNLGWIYDRLGEPELALGHYTRAAKLAHRSGDRLARAQILNNVAKLKRRFGDLDQALSDYEQALEIFREMNERRWEGRVLNNIAHTYSVLGELQQAQVFFDESLVLRRAVGDRRGEVFSLNNSGRASRRLGNLEHALAQQNRSVALAIELGDPSLQATSLTMLGWTHLAGLDPGQALVFGKRALDLLDESKQGAMYVDALHLVGRASTSLGQGREALVSLQQALSLLRQMQNHPEESGVLTALARVKRELGQLDEALVDLEAAVDSVEDIRTRVITPERRATLQSSHRETFELYIEGLMTLHYRHPDERHDLDALIASEQARARSLRDLLSEAEARIEQGVDPALLRQREALGRRLNAKAERRAALLDKPQKAQDLAEAELEIASVLRRLDLVEATVRRSSPGFAALSQPTSFEIDEIQQLLDKETLLLEYALGEQRSFLWAVSSDDVASFALPARREIEDLARHFHSLLSRPGISDRAEQARVAQNLAEKLLGPIAPRLTQRLLVVADGALHYVPFAALPLPTSDTNGPRPPLITRYEVVSLPSASVLIQLREKAKRSRAEGWLAMIADPVTTAEDLRLANGVDRVAAISHRSPRSIQRGAAENLLEFPRLPGSKKEAEAILALAPSAKTLPALGFQANLETIAKAELSRHRIVHFATHGVIDANRPRLSGLLLSLYKPNGQPRVAMLRLHDIYNLKLNADLVVLSGCQTALGRELAGEGLVGLIRGFMYAGAERVLASLWQTEDRATAELMIRFYRSLWEDGMTPARALRHAQLSIRQEKRWQDPYYWGTFVLLGDS